MNIMNLGSYLIVFNVPSTLNYLLKPWQHRVGQSFQVNVGSHLTPVRTGLTDPILTELVCLCSIWFNPRASHKCWPKVVDSFVWVCFECSWRWEECSAKQTLQMSVYRFRSQQIQYLKIYSNQHISRLCKARVEFNISK